MKDLNDRISKVRDDIENSVIEIFSILQENTDDWKDAYVDNLAETAVKLKKLSREL